MVTVASINAVRTNYRNILDNENTNATVINESDITNVEKVDSARSKYLFGIAKNDFCLTAK